MKYITGLAIATACVLGLSITPDAKAETNLEGWQILQQVNAKRGLFQTQEQATQQWCFYVSQEVQDRKQLRSEAPSLEMNATEVEYTKYCK